MNTILNLFGPSTAGKSTTANLLQDHVERLYTVDYDVVKRQIAKYNWKRDADTGRELTFDMLAAVTKVDLPILLIYPVPKTQDEITRMRTIAEAGNYKLLNIEITAPREVLIERYKQRLESIRQSGSTWIFRTLEEFTANLDVPYLKPDDTITFDSSQMDPQAILDGILKLIADAQ